MTTTVMRRLDRLASAQHGLIERSQALGAGLTDGTLRLQLDRGVLVPVHAGVYRSAGAHRTWEQELLAACLAAGPHALASHRAAAVVWGLAERPAPIELTVPGGRGTRLPGVVVHRSTDLRPVDGVRRHGVPVTNPIRTLGDLGAVAPQLVPRAVEQGTYRNLFTTAALWRLVDDLARPGRRGVGVLRRVLEQRALADARSCSPLESTFADIAADMGIAVEYQHVVEAGGRRYVLDFALPAVKLGIEVDGLDAHASRTALDGDLARQNALALAGWQLLRYTATHLVRRRAAIGREVVALAAARRPVERAGSVR